MSIEGSRVLRGKIGSCRIVRGRKILCMMEDVDVSTDQEIGNLWVGFLTGVNEPSSLKSEVLLYSANAVSRTEVTECEDEMQWSRRSALPSRPMRATSDGVPPVRFQ
jgi:hypothetical protein